jgi:peroxiredoxin
MRAPTLALLSLAALVLAPGCTESKGSAADPAAPTALSAAPAAEPASAPKAGAPPEPGAPAPLFALPVAGEERTVALADELKKNKLTVVMFIATKCPYSNAYNERMESMAKAYGEKGVGFLGINSNYSEPVDQIVAHAKEHGFTFPVLKDEKNIVADQYAATKTPEILVVDPEGKVLYHGRIDENYEDPTGVKEPDLKNALDAALAGQPIPAPTTKAFGCSIKRV